MKIVAGLGNPGKRYENTRHNLGFMVVDKLADEFGIQVIKSKHKALIGEKIIDGDKIMLVKPMTFMNLSGKCIKEIVSYYNCNPSDIIVIYDDCALPVGAIRVRKSGSDGGHNGMKSIIGDIGTSDFVRIRVGIGQKPPEWDLADYVLSCFDSKEKPEMEKAAEYAAEGACLIIRGQVDLAMNKYNKRAQADPRPTDDELAQEGKRR